MPAPCAPQTELDSFLIEISALILAKKDEDGQPLVDKILDKTGMKGTGARPAAAAHPPLHGASTCQARPFGLCIRCLLDVPVWEVRLCYPRCQVRGVVSRQSA